MFNYQKMTSSHIKTSEFIHCIKFKTLDLFSDPEITNKEEFNSLMNEGLINYTKEHDSFSVDFLKEYYSDVEKRRDSIMKNYYILSKVVTCNSTKYKNNTFDRINLLNQLLCIILDSINFKEKMIEHKRQRRIKYRSNRKERKVQLAFDKFTALSIKSDDWCDC